MRAALIEDVVRLSEWTRMTFCFFFFGPLVSLKKRRNDDWIRFVGRRGRRETGGEPLTIYSRGCGVGVQLDVLGLGDLIVGK